MNLRRMFLNLRIRLKLIIAFGSLLMLSVILVLVAINSIYSILELRNLGESLDKTNLRMSQADIYLQEFANEGYKDLGFLSNGSNDLTDGYTKEMDSVMNVLEGIRNKEVITSSGFTSELNRMEAEIVSFDEKFEQLVSLYKQRGFQDYGLEGQLRAAIHSVENSSFPYDKVQMLMLRRHEKDFFLRKDLKYLNKFNDQIEAFLATTVASEHEEGKQEVISAIENYKGKFNAIVELESEIGLNVHNGLVGQLNEHAEIISEKLQLLTTEIKQHNKLLINNTILLLVGLFLGQLLIGLVLVLFYSGILTKTIKEIKNAMVSLSQGEFPEELVIRSKDELGQTKVALNQLMERIKTAAGFANNLGQGNLKAKYDDRFNNDVLAKSIISMQEKLIEADAEQKIVNWTNEGLAKFNDILKNDTDQLGVLGDRIISQMVNYLNVNQGAIYINEGEGIRRIASYAYDKKKFIDQVISVGSGLIGQSVLEGESIYIKEVPEDYMKITSGLGEATASCILITPLKIRDEIVGVIELASFNLLEDYQIEFVERVSESIANIINGKKVAEQTQKLLQESRDKTAELISQEEELKQHNEEMLATREEMERQKKEMDNLIDELKGQLAQQYLEKGDLRKASEFTA
ncbi:GAF domain-containing protein [Fulvivirga ligni]|uniref:GAF domain-containing protein n=1 Tax=Fulvivirga ligni TaxID=2904246 RepID=UPI001F3F80A8|nr:GAF domain-containing protein [Fulvivirga ligni]UII22203.1 GAF domain-containing protein [Fulvivirga ligni]